MALGKKILEYIEENKNAWTPATQRSTRYALQGCAAHLDGKPETLWNYLKAHQAAYTRVTTWTRVVKFWGWLKGENGSRNPYSEFRERNAQLFKHTYIRRPSSIAFRDAKARCERIEDRTARKKALELLYTGMRLTESSTYKDGLVVGKGGKVREILSMPHIEGESFSKSEHTFRRRLRQVGLKPHELRKVMANKCHKAGMTEFDLCQTFGWESLETAKSYISASRRTKRQQMILEALNGDDDDES